MTIHSPLFKSAKGEAEFNAAYDAAMNIWQTAYTERDIPTSFGDTHVILSGPEHAPPLVLLHCALMTSAIWAPLIGDLSRQYRVYAIDVMGDMGRSLPTHPPQNEQELADWLNEVLQKLGIERTYLLGWSYGGFVAANFTIHYPDTILKLGLLAPIGTFVRIGPGFLYGFLPLIIPTRAMSRLFESVMAFQKSFSYPEHSELLYQRFRNGHLIIKVPPRHFTDEELHKLSMPTLVLIGQQELLFNPYKAVKRAKELLPDSTVELINHCNHAIVSDQTELIKTRILDFLEQ
jgi:pimeloyl-ACP methyl ester carboxylesterase